jgi:hypothetical protein
MAKLAQSAMGKQNRRARTLRDLRISARAGNYAAIRALLRKYGWPQLADEVRRGKPIPAPISKMVRALTAGVGTHDKLDDWEFINERGEIESLLHDPPPLGMPRVPRAVFED